MTNMEEKTKVSSLKQIELIRVLTEVFRVLFLVLLLSIAILPFVWTLFSSLKNNREILSSAISLPMEFRISNYIGVITETPVPRFYLNSLVVAPLSTLFALMVYGMGAYVLARTSFRARNAIFGMLSLTLLIPTTAVIFPVYRLVTSSGLYNTKTALVIVYMALAMPISLYILRSYFLTIPKDLEAAAYIDGASFIRTYFTIILPIAQPGFSAAAVLAFLNGWNDFFYAFILTSGSNARTVPIAIQFFQTEFSNNYGRMFATIIMVIIPTVIIYIALQKKIETGLVAGSIKG